MFLKNLFLYIFTVIVILASDSFSQQNLPLYKNQQVNYIVGDESFLNTFGTFPEINTDEKLRVKTHLLYVKGLLKNKKQQGLSAALFNKRNLVIQHLNDYIVKEQFPVNYDYKNRRIPCFIDKDGNICAVGYLIEQTDGRSLAEDINSKYKYSYIHEMKGEKLSVWVKNSGLTLNECAMIQPTYGEPDYDETGQRLTVSYALSSSLSTGVNLTMSALNIINIAKEKRSFSNAVIGMISGMFQLTLGMLNIQGPSGSNYLYSTESRRIVSILNIGLGSATTILSMINLFSDDKPKSSGNKSTFQRFKK